MTPATRALVIAGSITGGIVLLAVVGGILIVANTDLEKQRQQSDERTALWLESAKASREKRDLDYSRKPSPSDNTYQGWDSRHYGRMLKDSDELTFFNGIEGCRIIGDRHAVWCLAEALLREPANSKWIASLTDAIRLQGATAKDALPALRHVLQKLGPAHKDAQRIADSIKKIEGS